MFISKGDLNDLGLVAGHLSPPSYLVDGMASTMGQGSVFNWAIDILALVLFTGLFVFASGRVLTRNLMKGL